MHCQATTVLGVQQRTVEENNSQSVSQLVIQTGIREENRRTMCTSCKTPRLKIWLNQVKSFQVQREC